MLQAFTQVGSVTTALQAAASAVGAGIVLGGFLAGALGMVRGWARQDLERRVLRCGYAGGLVAAALLIFDSVTRCLA